MLALVLAAALGQALQPFDPGLGPIYSQPAGMGSLAFFEAFPASGQGAGAACACTTPTGARGETLTFSRASTVICTKTAGVEPQQIANGDLVTCASGQPAVMPGADGTAVNGLLVEAATTNQLPQSDPSNAAWATQTIGVAAMTVTANAGTAPDGTNTAVRLQIPALTAGGQASLRYLAPTAASASMSGSMYVRGYSGSGTTNLVLYRDGTNATCASCAYSAGYWTRCADNVGSIVSFGTFGIGSSTIGTTCGGSSAPAADILVWGAQEEAGSVPTSYIPTAGATATRQPAAPSAGSITWSSPAISIASTWLLPSTVTASASAFTVAKDATNYVVGYASGGAFVCDFVVAGVSNTVTGPAMSAGTAARVACYYDGANRAACVNGTCSMTAGALGLFSTGPVTYYFGTRTAAGNEARGVVKQACLDPSPARCR